MIYSDSLRSETNPKALAQSVNMTAAASGSSGITVADDDDIDFGTGNFTLVWKGSLPDWTPSAPVKLLWKMDTDAAPDVGINLGVGYPSAGSIYFTIKETVYSSSIVNTFVDNTVHELAVVTTVGATNTLVDLYFDGMAFGAQQTAANPGSVSNAIALEILGDLVSRTAGTVTHAYTLNYAMTAAEVLDLYQKGIAFADKYGSQTSIITGTDSTFAGASNWANVDINAYDETTGGVLTITASVAAQYCTLPVANATTVANKKYRLTYTVASIAATWTVKDFGGTVTIGTISANATGASIEFTASTTGGLRLVAVANNSSGVFDNFLLYEIGATLALTPESWQSDKPYDASGNNLTCAYPASGWSLTRPLAESPMQPTPTDGSTGAVTVTIAMILNGIITGNPSAARAYTFETGATSDAWPSLQIDMGYEWSIINTNATYAITLTAASGHTIVGIATIAPYSSARFLTRKTAANTFVTYRIAVDNDEAVAMSSKLTTPGAWTTPTFDAANFAAVGGGSWTVADGDVGTYAYQIMGKIMTVAFSLDATTVAAIANTLTIKIPASKTVTKAMYNTFFAQDNGTSLIGISKVAAGGTVIILYKDITFAAWAAATNTTAANGQITFEID